MLALTEASFQGLLEAAPDAIVIVDPTGLIVLINSQAERLFGYKRSELIGQAIELLLPERLRGGHIRHRSGYMGEPHTRPMGVGLDLVACRKDGSEFSAEISLSPFPTADGTLVTAVVRDVTQRKRAADELERQVHNRTAHLNALLQFSGELLLARNFSEVLQRALHHALALVAEAHHAAVYLYNEVSDRLDLHASAGFELLLPKSLTTRAGIIGRAFISGQTQHTQAAADWIVLEADEAAENAPTGAIAQPLIAQSVPIGVLLLLRDRGTGAFALDSLATIEGLANLTAAALVQEQNRKRAASLTSLVAVLEDQQRLMAERLTSAEAAMVQSARLAAMGQLAASIAHEINNPLYAIRNSLVLLEEDLPESMRTSPYLQLAQDQLGRIAKIIEGMRDFYRPQKGDFAPVDLNMVLRETLALAELNARSSNIEMIFLPQVELPLVVGVIDQLRQVFLNLMLNAIDAMDEAGTLTVRTFSESNTVIAAVSDTGPGIPDEDLPQLFEPFFTTKAHGTGLGLAISAHIVQHHQGRIDVDSRPDHGCTFFVALPVMPRTGDNDE